MNIASRQELYTGSKKIIQNTLNKFQERRGGANGRKTDENIRNRMVLLQQLARPARSLVRDLLWPLIQCLMRWALVAWPVWAPRKMLIVPLVKLAWIPRQAVLGAHLSKTHGTCDESFFLSQGSADHAGIYRKSGNESVGESHCRSCRMLFLPPATLSSLIAGAPEQV